MENCEHFFTLIESKIETFNYGNLRKRLMTFYCNKCLKIVLKSEELPKVVKVR